MGRSAARALAPPGPWSALRPQAQASPTHSTILRRTLIAAVSVPLKPDRDRAWRDFAGWRVNYDTTLLTLARLTVAPAAPWTSDRPPR